MKSQKPGERARLYMFIVAAIPTHHKKAQNTDTVFRERTARVPGLPLGLGGFYHKIGITCKSSCVICGKMAEGMPIPASC